MLSRGLARVERLQCPSSTLPILGKKCGRRERGADAEARGAILVTIRRRGGGRHLGLRDDVVLRGTAPERRSRPVRRGSWRSLPLRARAPATTGAPWTPRRGTSSACVKHHTHPARRPTSAFREPPGTRPSLGPRTRARLRGFGHAIGQPSRSGKPGQPGGTVNEVGRSDRARLAARHRSARSSRARVRKGRRSRPPSLRDLESSGSSARTS